LNRLILSDGPIIAKCMQSRECDRTHHIFYHYMKHIHLDIIFEKLNLKALPLTHHKNGKSSCCCCWKENIYTVQTHVKIEENEKLLTYIEKVSKGFATTHLLVFMWSVF